MDDRDFRLSPFVRRRYRGRRETTASTKDEITRVRRLDYLEALDYYGRELKYAPRTYRRRINTRDAAR